MKTLQYLKEKRKFFYVAGFMFFLSLIVGLFQPFFNTAMDSVSESFISAELSENYGIILDLFKNNIFAMFLSVALSFLIFYPFYVVLFNGYFLGYFITSLVNLNHVDYWDLWRLLPHGIFELSALFISAGLGINLVIQVFKKIFGGERTLTFWEEIGNSFNVFLFVVVPLTLIAAIIEGVVMLL